MKRIQKLFVAVLIMSLVFGLFSSCSNEQENVPAEATPAASELISAIPEATTEVPAAEPADGVSADNETIEELPEVTFPLVEPGSVSVSIWYPLLPFAAMMGDASTPENWQFFKELTARSGIAFDFQICGSEVASDQFSLMVAGGEYTDLFGANYYTGGIDRAIEDEVYLELTELIDTYCPNYAAQLKREDIKRDAYTNNGNIGVFYHLANEKGFINGGLGINGNLLARYDIDKPETYAEYDVFLQMLKNDNVETPLYRQPFEADVAGGYNNIDDWVVIDGTVQYGLVNDNSKEYYQIMADWYAKGYLMQDYYTSDIVSQMDEVFNATAQMTVGVIGGTADAIGRYPETNLEPMSPMLRNKGDVIHVASQDTVLNPQSGWIISTQCDEEKQILIAKLVDYLYTDEGMILNTWGVEGVSFEYDSNGDPQIIDSIMSEFSIGMLSYFKYMNMSEAGLYDMRRTNYGLGEKELAACEFWGSYADNSALYPNASMNDDEMDVYNRYFADAETYIEEFVNGLITGQHSIDEWDSFTAELTNALHFDEVVAVKQSAYDRYMSK